MGSWRRMKWIESSRGFEWFWIFTYKKRFAIFNLTKKIAMSRSRYFGGKEKINGETKMVEQGARMQKLPEKSFTSKFPSTHEIIWRKREHEFLETLPGESSACKYCESSIILQTLMRKSFHKRKHLMKDTNNIYDVLRKQTIIDDNKRKHTGIKKQRKLFYKEKNPYFC